MDLLKCRSEIQNYFIPTDTGFGNTVESLLSGLLLSGMPCRSRLIKMKNS